MRDKKKLPQELSELVGLGCISESDIVMTDDGFVAVCSSLSDILAARGIYDFPDSEGERLMCDRFFDDWHIYYIKGETGHVYGLFKLREQEHDARDGEAADGDTPGVTVSFISYSLEALLSCLKEPTEENRIQTAKEIDRVVAAAGQRHHRVMKTYFADPQTKGSYLIAQLYVKHIASFAENGRIEVPLHYKEIVQESLPYKSSSKLSRLPRFINSLNERAGYTVCDHKVIYIKDKNDINSWELEAILATHTGNVSVYSFAAEVEYHARFLIPAARVRLPFFGKSIYASAIRADMTVDDTEFEGPAPFYRTDSRIVKRQERLHREHFTK